MKETSWPVGEPNQLYFAMDLPGPQEVYTQVTSKVISVLGLLPPTGA